MLPRGTQRERQGTSSRPAVDISRETLIHTPRVCHWVISIWHASDTRAGHCLLAMSRERFRTLHSVIVIEWKCVTSLLRLSRSILTPSAYARVGTSRRGGTCAHAHASTASAHPGSQHRHAAETSEAVRAERGDRGRDATEREALLRRGSVTSGAFGPVIRPRALAFASPELPRTRARR